jgi:hypothetical protein
MDEKTVGTAIYLVGHGSKTKPRLIELQHQRILRYRRALLYRYDINRSAPTVFIDLHLPSFGMGQVDLMDVPEYMRLLQDVDNGRFGIVYIDIDEVKPGLTPDYESAFVRSMLEDSGAKVLNAFTDDRGVFVEELKDRCGQKAREYEITDSSDLVCFFPSLVGDATATALRRELEVPIDRQGSLERIHYRIDSLKRLRPYSGGGIPFIEDRLSSDWNKTK